MIKAEPFHIWRHLVTNIKHLAHISRDQDFRCIYCQIRMRWPRHTHATKPTTVTKEHVLARHHKGGDERENLAAACCRCNVMKSDIDTELFIAIIDKLFEVAFIRKHWHTTDKNTFRFIRKIFRYEVDATMATRDKEAAFRVAEQAPKYSLDVLIATGVPLQEQVPPVH